MCEPSKERPNAVERKSSRWWLPLLLGLVGGLLAGFLAMGFSWSMIPSTYRASASIRIAEKNPTILSDVGGDDTMLTLATAATLIKSNFVLKAALKKPGIAQLACIRNASDPVLWLKERLEVRLPGDAQIVEISLRGENRKELVGLLDAVKSAIMDEIVIVDRTSWLQRKQTLETAYRRNQEEIKRKTYAYELLAEKMKDKGPEHARLAMERQSDVVAQLHIERNRLQIELRGVQKRRQILVERLQRTDDTSNTDQEPSDTTQAELRGMLDAVELDEVVLQAKMEEVLVQTAEAEKGLTKPAVSNVELENKRLDLQRLKKITSRMGDESQRREIELAAAPRVTILEAVTVSKTPDLKKKHLTVVAISFGGFLGGAFLGLELGLLLLKTRRKWSAETHR